MKLWMVIPKRITSCLVIENNTRETMNQTKTLCHMAWDYPMFFMFTNNIGYCCRTPKIPIDDTLLDEMGEDFWSNHPTFVKRRHELVNGIKSQDCDTCWKLEDAGFKSARHDAHINQLMKKNDPTFPLTLPYAQYKFWPNVEKSNVSNCIEIVLNNTCDAKCTYCSEFYSTQWLTEKKKYQEVSRSYTPQESRNPKAEQLFWSWYENKVLTSNKRFGFIGGEPFIIDALYECFDKLLEIHERNEQKLNLHDKMELCITSNLNTPPAYFQKFLEYVPKLEKYFKIIIQVSGENIGEDLEYIRHGVKWERWSKNIEYLLENTKVTLAFLPCLNLLTIPRFHLYLEYFASLCRKYTFMSIHQNIVTHPVEQSPMIAPKEFAIYFDKCIEIIEGLLKEKIYNKIVEWSYLKFLEWLKTNRDAIKSNPSESEVTDNAIKFFRFFSKLDARRQSSVIKVFPEFATFYQIGSDNLGKEKIIPIRTVK